MKNTELVTLLESNYMHELQIAKSILDKHNIQTFVFDENVNSIYGGVLGGYKLKINALQLEEAKQILEAHKTEDK